MQFQIIEGWWLSAQPGTIDSFNISEVTFTKYRFVYILADSTEMTRKEKRQQRS